MVKLKERFNNFIERTFHDEIVAVEPPRECWMEYRDVGRRLEAYIVPITYKYRGVRNAYFDIDNDHFLLVTPEKALKNANSFYLKILQQIKKRNENTK